MESLHFATEFRNVTYSDIEYFRSCKSEVNKFLNDLFNKTCHNKEDDIYFDGYPIENSNYIEIDKSSFNKMLNYVRRLDKDDIILDCKDVNYTAGEIQSIMQYMQQNSPENTTDIMLIWYE